MSRLLGGVVLATVLGVSAGATGQVPAPAAVDVQRLGPQVGEIVPPFTLRDHTGAVRTLQDALGPKGGLLVFARSADW